LSGGEKSRLIIARMIMAEDNVLALDEPTNHLDLESIESLNYALSQYEGTVLFVSHDREFVSSLATRIIEVTPERVMDFTGTYDEYLSKEGNDFFKRQNSSAVLAGSK
ncbi:MAG TPA: ATP-binding cassette domain-containing protein, partial [Leptospiraceae bacterium]|nr:ATP-binding cassette domain-containing protein [Leptospiraceae bacterium]